MRARQFATVTTLLLVTLSACSGNGRGPGGQAKVEAPPGGVLVRGAGATFPALLYKSWFSTYQKEHPKVAIDYDVVGSGEGVRRFVGKEVDPDDQVDFGASDAAMTDKELAEVPDGVLMVPMTAGSLVLAYNLPGFTAELRLSRKAYEGIFLGDITKWDDPVIATANPGVKLPHLEVAVVVRSDRSGTTFAFTNHLSAMSDAWRTQHGASTAGSWPANVMRVPGNEGVAGRIKLAEGAIGYVNYGSAIQADLPMATLENKAGTFVKPTPESGTDTLASTELPENMRVFMPDPSGVDAYPIVTFSWILLHRNYADRAKAEALGALLRWCLLDGQRFGPDLGYVPLPPAVVSKALVAVDGVAGGLKTSD